MDEQRERERQLLRLQAQLCQTLADPTRLEILQHLRGGPKAVKDLVAATGQRQAKVSQHLALLRQQGIVDARRVGNAMHYTIVDPRILDACQITREMLLSRLSRHAALVD